jgi:hypothetical protein
MGSIIDDPNMDSSHYDSHPQIPQRNS